MIGEVYRANNEAYGSNTNRIPQSSQRVAYRLFLGFCEFNNQGSKERYQSAKYAITNMVRQRHRRVPYFGWEDFNEECCNWSINQSHKNDMYKHKEYKFPVGSIIQCFLYNH